MENYMYVQVRYILEWNQKVQSKKEGLPSLSLLTLLYKISQSRYTKTYSNIIFFVCEKTDSDCGLLKSLSTFYIGGLWRPGQVVSYFSAPEQCTGQPNSQGGEKGRENSKF